MSVDIENSKAQMRKGILEFCILAILSDGEHYPTEIIERMKNAKLLVVEGTLYPLLTRLKKEDLLTYRWQESPSGPPRKYYALTASGRLFLQSLHESWAQLNSSVSQILQTAKIQAS
jgi:PadR family transcriptional regulator PadR